MAVGNTLGEKKSDHLHLERSLGDGSEKVSPLQTNIPAGYIASTDEESAVSRSLNLKMDVFLLPFLSLLYLFNGLDRGNVGNAQTQGETPTTFPSPF